MNEDVDKKMDEEMSVMNDDFTRDVLLICHSDENVELQALKYLPCDWGGHTEETENSLSSRNWAFLPNCERETVITIFQNTGHLWTKKKIKWV